MALFCRVSGYYFTSFEGPGKLRFGLGVGIHGLRGEDAGVSCQSPVSTACGGDCLEVQGYSNPSKIRKGSIYKGYRVYIQNIYTYLGHYNPKLKP